MKPVETVKGEEGQKSVAVTVFLEILTSSWASGKSPKLAEPDFLPWEAA